jgi:bacterioferritin
MITSDTSVIAALQTSVAMHLTAIEHYSTLAEHLDRWGYSRLGEKYRADAEEERGHFKKCVERLEFYDVAPVLTHPAPSWPRHDFAGILVANMQLEQKTAIAERANILASRAVGDELSALVFADLLEGSEESIEDIQAVQSVIKQIGLDNYLADNIA